MPNCKLKGSEDDNLRLRALAHVWGSADGNASQFFLKNRDKNVHFHLIIALLSHLETQRWEHF